MPQLKYQSTSEFAYFEALATFALGSQPSPRLPEFELVEVVVATCTLEAAIGVLVATAGAAAGELGTACTAPLLTTTASVCAGEGAAAAGVALHLN